MTEFDIFSRSLKDFFTPKMLKIALVPLLVTMVLLYMLFFSAADYGISSLQQIAQEAQNGQEVIVDEEAPFYFVWATYFIVFLFKYSFTSWIAGFLLYTLGVVVVLKVSVLLTIVVIGFLTPMITNILHKRYYSHLTLHGDGTLSSTFIVLMKSLIIMIILFILFIPLYFIPVINFIAFSFPFYYFFHKLLNFDISSTILSKDEYRIIYKKEANKFRLRTLSMYFLSMLPFLTLFSAVFFVIYLSHAYFIKLDELYQLDLSSKKFTDENKNKSNNEKVTNKKFIENQKKLENL